jgi:hypothetical protein
MKPGRPPVPLEIDIQSSFRGQLRYIAPTVSMVAIPNAGKRGPLAVRRLKREGMATGFPDCLLIWDGGVCFVEFKRPGQKPNDNQAEWLERLTRWGFVCGVAQSVEEAVAILRRAGAVVTERAS